MRNVECWRSFILGVGVGIVFTAVLFVIVDARAQFGHPEPPDVYDNGDGNARFNAEQQRQLYDAWMRQQLQNGLQLRNPC